MVIVQALVPDHGTCALKVLQNLDVRLGGLRYVF
jgi:hypothetical protein